MIGSEQLIRLAGRQRFSDVERAGLPPLYVAQMLGQQLEAKRAARLSTRAFLALRGEELRAFCARYHLTRAEVRLGQHFVELTWLTWRASKLVSHVAAIERKRIMQ